MIKSTQIVVINDDELSYELVRSSKRKRSLSMKLRKDNVLQLNAPMSMPLDEIEAFIQSKQLWIKTKTQEQNQQTNIAPKRYKMGEQHSFLGENYPLELITAKQSFVKLAHEKIYVYHRKNASIINLLNKWYKQQALNYFIKRTEIFANSYHFPKVQSIKVRYMTARWGSCDSHNKITYNIHLIKASPELIDYVVIHELCHLIHANHGARFYQLQGEINPNWKAQKQKLNKLGFQFIP